MNSRTTHQNFSPYFYQRYLGRFCQQWGMGQLHMYATKEHLLVLAFETNHAALQKRMNLQHPERQRSSVIDQAVSEIEEYFQGKRENFTIPLAPWGTAFEHQCWQQLLHIPYGVSCTYQNQAQQIGNPGAARAVGTANGRNPLSILIPCHRVIGKNETLRGYAGGLELKNQLLQLEGHKKLRGLIKKST